MWVQMSGAHYLNDGAPRDDLIAMLTRLDRAEIGRAWIIFNQPIGVLGFPKVAARRVLDILKASALISITAVPYCARSCWAMQWR